jgi:hypothetical protein
MVIGPVNHPLEPGSKMQKPSITATTTIMSMAIVVSNSAESPQSTMGGGRWTQNGSLEVDVS